MKGTALYIFLSTSMRHLTWSFSLSLMSWYEGSSSSRRILADHLASSVCDVISHVKLLDGRHGGFCYPCLNNQQASPWVMEVSETKTCILCVLPTIDLGSA